jgi:hypothetical protein
MLKLAVALYVVNALMSLAFGLRYYSRTDFMPYQAKAVGHGVADLSPEPRTVILAMLKVIGGCSFGFGIASLGLCVALWQSCQAANWALALGSVAVIGPALIAASRVNRLGPEIGAPSRNLFAGAAIAAAAFVAALVA